MISWISIVTFLIYSFSFNSCYKTNRSNSVNYLDSTISYNYDLNDPSQYIKLPSNLVEISGLTYWSDSTLACINDEKGNIYFIDFLTEEVIGKHDFGKNDDYEGIEKVGSSLYVTNSSGTLFEINYALTDSEQVVVFNTPLKSKNNIEGLGYDPVSQSLLLACKDDAGINASITTSKSVYAWNITSKTLDTTPRLSLDLNKIRKQLKRKKSFNEKLREFFGSGSGNLTFKPSGIAVHPISKEIYIIAHQGSIMLVTDKKSKIKKIYPLMPKLFKQPEGICFLPDGTLVISNEGGGGKANLLFFYEIK